VSTRVKKIEPGIYRLEDGRYQVLYRDKLGKQRAEHCDRLDQARDFKAAARVDKKRGQFIDPRAARVPFNEWARTWFKSRHKLGDSKRSKSLSVLEKHIIGDSDHGLGRMQLGRITAVEVQEWVNWMVVAGYKPSYIRGAYTLLGGALRGAKSHNLIAEAPLNGIELPQSERKRERFLSEIEIERLVAAFDPFHRALVLTASWSGCRWGELAGLLRDNLDLDHGRLHVRTVLVLRDDGGKLTWGLKDYPKSDSGRRTIGLPASLVIVLRQHLERAADNEFVFRGKRGGTLAYSNFRKREWEPAVERSGLKPLSFHDLRHTHVALLIQYGWQEYQIVRRLGWKDGKMLHTTYGHLFPGHDAELVAELDEKRQRALLRETGNVTAFRQP
jgi:integrase